MYLPCYYPNAIASAVGSSEVKPALVKYVFTSVNATCFIVPLSFVTTLSASTNVVEEADVSPSMMLSSVVVAVTPSKRLSSAVVDVTPSSRFISVAVAVTATSSFIFGLVSVLLVSVAVDAVETKSTSPPVLGNVKVFDALSE